VRGNILQILYIHTSVRNNSLHILSVRGRSLHMLYVRRNILQILYVKSVTSNSFQILDVGSTMQHPPNCVRPGAGNVCEKEQPPDIACEEEQPAGTVHQ
jgi:hypothetical protein